MKKLIILFFLFTIEVLGQCPAGQYYDPVTGYCFDDPDSYTEYLSNGIRLRKYGIGDNPGYGYNQNIDDIADIFLHREYEYQVNQIRVTNGSIIVASGSRLDFGSDSLGVNWSYAKLVFEDVTGRGQVPFKVGDIIFSRTIAKDGAGYDSNGNIIDSDALIRNFVYEVDSLDGLNVWVVPHSDILTPSNKSAPEPGDTFVRLGNITTGGNVIEISSDLKYSPRISMIVDIKSWSDYLAASHKAVILGNLNGQTDADGLPIVTDVYGLLIDGSLAQGKAILKNVDLSISGGPAQDEINSKVAAADLGNMAYEDLVELSKLGSTIISGGYVKTTLINAAALIIGSGQVTGLGDLATMNESQINYLNINNIPSLGDLAYDDLVELSKLGTTIIQGGYFKTNLIDVDELFAQNVTASGTVNGGLFQGGVYQTASTGQRAVLSGTGLTFYSSSGGTAGLYASQNIGGVASLYLSGPFYPSSVEAGILSSTGNVEADGNIIATSYGSYISGFSLKIGGNTIINYDGTLSNITDYGLDATDIPPLSLSKLTSGTWIGSSSDSGLWVATSSGGSPVVQLKKRTLTLGGSSITVYTTN